MADGKGNEAQGHIRDHRKRIHLLKGIETQARNSQPSQDTGTDQHTGHQVGSDVRQMKFIKQTGHQQSGEKGNRNQQKRLHSL